MQPHSLSRFRIESKYSCRTIHARRLRVGVDDPTLRNVVADDEYGRFVGRILDDILLLCNLDGEVRALAIRDLFFYMLRRQHAFKMTDGVIAKGANMVADN